MSIAGAPYPHPSSEATTIRMKANRSRDTGPEIAVRRLLYRRGRRYRVDYQLIAQGYRIRPDIAFVTQRIAVFIDGCFWHGCPEHRATPHNNSEYWSAKFARNQTRDARNTNALEQSGWTVLRYWEHEAPDQVAASIDTVVSGAYR